MARTAFLVVAALISGCGIASRDYTITQAFQAGGGAPTSASINSSQLTSQLSSDVSKINTVELSAASIQSLDSGDLTLIQAVSIVASGTGVSGATLATYSGPPAAGAKNIDLVLGSNTDLKPFLQNGGIVTANITYVSFPATARNLQLTLTIHGSLL
jgi:hypothetical protein